MGAEGDAPAKSRARTHAVLLSSDMVRLGLTTRASGVLLIPPALLASTSAPAASASRSAATSPSAAASCSWLFKVLCDAAFAVAPPLASAILDSY